MALFPNGANNTYQIMLNLWGKNIGNNSLMIEKEKIN